MKLYKIKYSENNVINKVAEIEAETINEALLIFFDQNPNANYEAVEVKEDEAVSIPTEGT